MKLMLLVKKLLMEFILRKKVTMNQTTDKSGYFGYFHRFLTRALTLRLRNKYIYDF